MQDKKYYYYNYDNNNHNNCYYCDYYQQQLAAAADAATLESFCRPDLSFLRESEELRKSRGAAESLQLQ